MQSAIVPFLAWLVMMLASGLPVAHAADRETRAIEVAAKMKKGHRALNAGRMEDALNAYQEATTIDPQNDAAIYNQAVVLYRAGELAKAAELFQRAAASESDTIAANARFNLGNTAYAQALDALETNPGDAAGGLKRAIEAYREGLALNPSDEDARTNIELAVKLLQQVQSQQEQQPQEQQQQDSQPSDSQQQHGEQESDGDEAETDRPQTQEADKQSQQSEESQQESQSGDSAGSEKGSQSENETTDDGETSDGEASEQPAPDDSTPPDESPEQPEQMPPEESRFSQPSAEPPAGDASQEQSPDGEGETQEEPDGQADQAAISDPAEQQAAAGELSAANEANGEAGTRQAALEDSAAMTLEEAQKMLQAIRDRAMLRRLRQQQIERSRRIPVEKDW